MDIQHFLALNIMVISAVALLGALLQRAAPLDPLWLAVNAAVLAAGAFMLQWAPGAAGTVVALIFVPLVLAPMVLDRMTAKRIAQRRMREAASLARIASWLHPTPGARFSAAVLAAQSGATIGEQKAALESLAQRSSPHERSAVQAMILRLESRWDELLAHLEPRPELVQAMPGVLIRALGETGRLDRMARAYEDAKIALHGNALWDAQLVLLAFTGRAAEVRRLLAGPLAHFDAEYQNYWIAIAERAAGNDASVWQPALQKLAATAASPATRQAARRVLDAGAAGQAPSSTLDEVATVIVEEAAGRMRRAPEDERQGAGRAPVTWLLLAAIVAGYALAEARGGSQNLRTLVDLGALWPPFVLRRGEWWRLATALFLHFGLLHIAVNGLMLLVLGRACERSFGSIRMALIYLMGGLASSAFVLWLATYGGGEPAVLVGASGAIMALFGGLGGRSLVMWLRYRDMLDARNLRMLAIVAALQVAVDMATPQVSLAAHASGFVAGCLIGAMLSWLSTRAAGARA